MIIRRSLVLALAVLVPVAAGAAVKDLTTIVPAGVPMAAHVSDVAGSVEDWKSSPFADLWSDPSVRTFFAPLHQELELERWNEVVKGETGHDLDELLAMITGDLVVFVDKVEMSAAGFDDEPDFELVAAVGVGDNAAELERLILAHEKTLATPPAETDDGGSASETVFETRTHRDIELHIRKQVVGDEVEWESGWAMVDGTWVVGMPATALDPTIDRILDGGLDDHLSAGANFQSIAGHLAGKSSWFFVDFDPWLPAIRTLVDAGLTQAQAAGSPFPVDPDALVDALGLASMRAAFAAAGFEGRTLAVNFGASYTEDKGLVKLLAYGPNQAPRSNEIPADSDAFSTGHFDFARAWSALVEIVNGINPGLMAMAAMQLESMQQQAGVELDLKADLLDNLTGEIVTVQNMGAVQGSTLADMKIEQDQVILLGIEDPEAMTRVISAVETMAGGGGELFSEREFGETSIHTLAAFGQTDDESGSRAAYALTDSHLVISIGSQATLEKVLGPSEAAATSVWKRAEVKRALSRLAKSPNGIQFQDVSAIGDLVFHGLALAETGMDSEGGDDLEFCDPSSIPPAGTVGKYISSAVNGVWKDEKEMLMKVYVLPAKGK